jgi:hypothetical protein
MGMSRWQAAKQVVNFANLSTPGGVLVGLLGRARFSRGPRGLIYATGYKLGFPTAPAFTIGNVVLARYDRAWLDSRPVLVKHEERHSWQYVCLAGLPMLPLYAVAAGWSWFRTGCYASRNPFERLAGLADGGYPAHHPRP